MTTAEEITFSPTPPQLKAKAAFHIRCRENPPGDLNLLSAQDVAQILESNAVLDWWSQPGFRSWFINKMEFAERVEYMVQLALDKSEDILTSTDPKAVSAQVNLIKALVTISGRDPGTKKEVKFIDESINQMSADQVDREIAKAISLKEKKRLRKVENT